MFFAFIVFKLFSGSLPKYVECFTSSVSLCTSIEEIYSSHTVFGNINLTFFPQKSKKPKAYLAKSQQQYFEDSQATEDKTKKKE